MMSSGKPILHYWKGRGRMEIVRLMLSAAGVEWENAPYFTKSEDYTKLRNDGLLMFGQSPLVQWDGQNMVQSMSIVRYIANKYGMSGQEPIEKQKIDMIMEGTRDFFAPMLAFGFKPDVATQWINTVIPKYMPKFEQLLSSSSSGYLVGEKMTMADVGLLEGLLLVDEEAKSVFDKYPLCKKFLDMMKNDSRIGAYLTSPKRFPPNDETYVKTVINTLTF